MSPSALFPRTHRIDCPHALKIPARRAEYSLTLRDDRNGSACATGAGDRLVVMPVRKDNDGHSIRASGLGTHLRAMRMTRNSHARDEDTH